MPEAIKQFNAAAPAARKATRVAIIDYHVGNVQSVANACEELGASILISNNPDEIGSADRIILPGVGAFGEGMNRLKELGLIKILETEVLEKKKPFLGICLGMQLLGAVGYEFGRHEGLGWIPGEVRKLEAKDLLLPHVGWNNVTLKNASPLFGGLPEKPDFYFVHSYHIAPNESGTIDAVCNYGEAFAAVVRRENIFGVQFHPEKSQKSGRILLENFLSL